MTLPEHEHIFLFGASECRCTPEEAANLAVVRAYRAAKVAERGQYRAPGFRRHRAGFQHIGDIHGVHSHGDDSIADRENVVLEMTAKDDKVWAIWRVVGHHTGNLYGLEATHKSIDVIEAGLWRIRNGLIEEAWFFGDELALLQQLGMYQPAESS